jgi:hypothetical protein
MKPRRMLKFAAVTAVAGLVVVTAAVAAGPPAGAGKGPQTTSATVTKAERNALVYMREEE